MSYYFDSDVFNFSASWEDQMVDPSILPWEDSECSSAWSSLVDWFDNNQGVQDYDGDGDNDLHDLARHLRDLADSLPTPGVNPAATSLYKQAMSAEALGGWADLFQNDTNRPKTGGGGGGAGGDSGGIE